MVIRVERTETSELGFGPNFYKSLVRRKDEPNTVQVCQTQTLFWPFKSEKKVTCRGIGVTSEASEWLQRSRSALQEINGRGETADSEYGKGEYGLVSNHLNAMVNSDRST